MATSESASTQIKIKAAARDPKEKEHTSEELTLPTATEFDLEKVKCLSSNVKSISMLITGKTGSGKLTLTNGILGIKLKNAGSAKESGDIDKGCTTEVTSYQAVRDKITVTVWDSPGLQDGTVDQKKYLKQMKEKCSERDLTIYCVNISQTRFVGINQNPDVVAMKKLTQTFGKKFWSNTIIVLTFANTLEAFNVEWEGLPADEKAKAFTRKIQQWERQIQEILRKEIKISEDIVTAIRIVPAGHYLKPHLPDCEYWFSALWFHCLDTILTPEVQIALVKTNVHRFKLEKNVTKEDFKRPPEEQPIIVNNHTMSMIRQVGTAAILGGMFGGLIGSIGLAAGPVAAATIPAGMVIGATVTGMIARVYHD